jgi:hypothetical protein
VAPKRLRISRISRRGGEVSESEGIRLKVELESGSAL